MKKILMLFATVAMLMSCSGNATTERVATDSIADTVATAIVPPAATEVLPAAAPGPDAGGKVATEVIADTTVAE